MTSPAAAGAEARPARAGAPSSRTYALLGGSALVLQTVFLREFLALFHSSELFAGAVLGVWLVLVGAGSALGEFASRRIAPARALAALYAVLGVLSVGIVPLVRWLPGAMGVPPGTLPPITIAVGIAAAAMLLPCLLVGASFSLTAAVRGDGARVYMWDAVGGLCGGLLATAFIIVLAPDAMLVCSGLAVIFGRLSWLWGSARGPKAWRAPGAVVMALGLALVLARGAREAAEKGTLALAFPGETVLEWAEGREGRWIVTETPARSRNLYLGGALAWSGVDRSAVEEFAALTALAHPDPRRVLVLASPADPLPFELARACPGAEIRAVVPYRTGMAERFAPRAAARRPVEFVERDARACLASAAGRGERTDVIACQPGLPQAFASSRLVSREAFADMAGALASGGVLALRLPFATSYQNEGVRKVLASVVRSLGAHFAHVRLEPLPHAGVVVLASARPLADVGEITKRYRARGALPGAFRPALLGSGAERRFRLDEIASAVRRTEAAANTDLLPSAVWYQARFTGSMYGKESRLSRLEPGTAWPGIVFAAILALACLVPARTGRAWGAGGGVALAVGAAGMLIEVTILCAYQVSSGALYGEVAVLLGLVMAGMALGANLAGRRAAHVVSASLGTKAIACACGVAPAALLAVAMLAAPGVLVRPVLWLLALATGSAVGAAYPVALALARGQAIAETEGPNVRTGAGYVLAADLAGAAAGSILGGGLLVPLLGLAGTALTGLAIALVAAGAILLAKRKR